MESQNAKCKSQNAKSVSSDSLLLLHFAFCILTLAYRSARTSSRHLLISFSSPHLLLIGFTLFTATALCGARSLVVPTRDLLAPVGLLLMLAGLAAYYRRRGEAAFVLSLAALAQIVAFVTSYIVL
ncbi:MAG TPA: hypothetical protein VFW87_13065, partial [Pirellulales bacterium]|nr:hypothetical protein [Pirellulales bacterium]